MMIINRTCYINQDATANAAAFSTYAIAIPRGTAFTLNIRVLYSPSGDPVNLAGYTINFTVKTDSDQDPPEIAGSFTVTDEANGLASIDVPYSATLGNSGLPGAYIYDVWGMLDLARDSFITESPFLINPVVSTAILPVPPPDPLPAPSLQPNWYIDPVDGNDDASGTQETTVGLLGPIKTWAEMMRRCGSYRLLAGATAIAVNVYLMNDLPALDPMVVDCDIVGAAKFWVTGINHDVLTTGQISAARPLDRSANVPPGVTDVSVDFGDFLQPGNLIVYTSGAHPDLVTNWIMKVEGTGIARTSFPAYQHDAVDSISQTPFALTGNETFEIQAPRRIGAFIIKGSTFNANPPAIRFSRLHFPGFSNNLGTFRSPATFSSCSFGFFLPAGTYCNFSNCAFYSVFGSGVFSWSFIQLGALINPVFEEFDGAITMDYDVQIQSPAATSSPGGFGISSGLAVHAAGIGVWDATGTFLRALVGQSIVVNTPIYGNGNTGYAIEVNGGRARMLVVPTIQASLGDILLGGKTEFFAKDPNTGLPISPKRTLTFATLAASVASGGFGGGVYDEETDSSVVIV